jgi:hypothetical protein
MCVRTRGNKREITELNLSHTPDQRAYAH